VANAGQRGLATGTLYSQDGPLVASIAQEGILRLGRDVRAALTERSGLFFSSYLT